jgi:hypothetical protein
MADSPQAFPLPADAARWSHDLWFDATRAAWVEQTPDGETMVLADRDAVGAVHPTVRLAPVAGAPTQIQAVGSRALWLELTASSGTVMERLSDGTVQPVPPLRNAHCTALSTTLTANGPLLLAVLRRADGGDTVGFWRLAADSWSAAGRVEAPGPVFRATLACGPMGALAAWDCYSDCAYRIHTAVPSATAVTRLLPTEPQHWETLPALAASRDGTWFGVRCRDCLIHRPDGAVNHHTRLVVAAHDGDTWQDVDEVDIDHAMNPWMAAYWGWRRYGQLIPAATGVWLLWEEKLDEQSMDPGPGRLLARQVTVAGPVSDTVVVDSGRSLYQLADDGVESALQFATKTQPHGFAWGMPYTLHTVDLNALITPRPATAPVHAGLPAYEHRTPSPSPRPVWDAHQLFFGDPHNHSRFSYDLDGEADEIYHVGRDVAGLDFMVFTENDATRFTEPLTPADWARSRALAERFNDPGRFTAFTAWEYTLHTHPERPESRDSHRNVIFPGADAPIVSWVDRAAPTPPDLTRAFAGQRVLLHHHHPGGYDLTDNDLERNIEICSGWWNCMRIPQFVERLHTFLDDGWRLGFVGGSDNHERNAGLGGALTGVWAEENTREAIFAAFEERRIFATTGLRPMLTFSVCDVPMGGAAATTAPPRLRAAVSCDTQVEAATVIRDGTAVHQWRGSTCEWTLDWQDAECPAGRHWYYLHVRFADTQPGTDWSQPMPLRWNLKPVVGVDAWSSPVHVEVSL